MKDIIFSDFSFNINTENTLQGIKVASIAIQVLKMEEHFKKDYLRIPPN